MAYVYRHLRKDTNTVFYIGIGSDNIYKRAHHQKGRNNYWHNIVNKHGFIAEIIEDNLTWDDACEREKYWIKFYGRYDLKEGCLVNMTDGGEGAFGAIRSVETRAKMSLAKQNMSDETRANMSLAQQNMSEETKEKIRQSTLERIRKGNLGNVCSDETIAKMSLAKQNMSAETKAKISKGNLGKVRSAETRKLLSDMKLGERNYYYNKKRPEHTKWLLEHHPNKKSVLQYNKLGEFIKKWDCAIEAHRILGVENISACCTGKRKIAGGFIWKFSQ